jgi:hypothetical protein
MAPAGIRIADPPEYTLSGGPAKNPNIGTENGLLLVGVTPAGLEHFFVERQGVDMETQQALFT